MEKDILALDCPPNMTIEIKDTTKLDVIEVSIHTQEGIYRDSVVKFRITIPVGYPHDSPRIKCLNRLLHPNIDIEGHVCLNILRIGWKPSFDLNCILFGIC